MPLSFNKTAMSLMCDQLMELDNTKPTITDNDYKNWQRQWIMDALRGYRYGQSFCEYFGIQNSSPLYYFQDSTIAERWIRNNYLEQ